MDKDAEKLVKQAEKLLAKCKKYKGKEDLHAFIERLKHGAANVVWAYALDDKRRTSCRKDFVSHLETWISEGLEKHGKALEEMK